MIMCGRCYVSTFENSRAEQCNLLMLRGHKYGATGDITRYSTNFIVAVVSLTPFRCFFFIRKSMRLIWENCFVCCINIYKTRPSTYIMFFGWKNMTR